MSVCLLFLVYAAEVQYYFAVIVWQCLELVVCCEHNYNVCFAVCLFVVSELEYAVSFDVGLYHKDVIVVASLHHFHYYLF